MNPQIFKVQTIPAAAVKVATGKQNWLHTGNLSAIINIVDDKGDVLMADAITVRDFIRSTFAELGIEVEFSGKNEFEKGVIIDMDADRIAELGLNADVLRFGQTVVKVDAAHQGNTGVNLSIAEAFIGPHQTSWKINDGLDALIVEMIKAALQVLKMTDI